ncbi:MAG: M28 family peptidase [Myxococcota bacterium]
MFTRSASLIFLNSVIFGAVAWAARSPAPPPLEVVAADLIGAALTSNDAYNELVELCDTIGHRITGSPALEAAIDWALAEMASDGLLVRGQPVDVNIWERGAESFAMISPLPRDLHVLGLGGTVATPPGGVAGEVVVADSFEHLASLDGDAVRDKIVLFDVPFTSYGETVQYRLKGPSAAAERGAKAMLLRSVTPESLTSPHTGTLRYADDAPKIPAAAVTIEDAAWMRRLQERGTPATVRLSLSGKFVDDGQSRNAIGEIRGRELPNEIVVLGCHIDSWDVGQGAQDDGGGCVAAMDAGRLIASLPTPPRRTVRVVLYTNEEMGLAGATTYAEAATQSDEVHVAAIESDTGMGHPAGFRVDVRNADDPAAAAAEKILQLAPIAALLSSLEADGLRPAFSGADIGPLVRDGALGLGVDHDTSGYWLIHHTEADTIEKIDPDNVRKTVAAMAVMAYGLAETL